MVNNVPLYQVTHNGMTTLYAPLPRGAWRPVGRCDCSVCKGAEGYWDTLALSADGSTWTVHYPELQRPRDLPANVRRVVVGVA
jgi:hypothetical protein